MKNLENSPRNQLKLEMYFSRALYNQGYGFAPICPFCSVPVRVDNADLHEALFARSSVQGASVENQKLIFDHRNVVIRHHICNAKQYHTGGTGGEKEWKKALDYLVYWEGRDNIESYIKMMCYKFRWTGISTLYRFHQYYPEEKIL